MTDYSASNTACETVDVIGIICNTLLIVVLITDPLKILHRGAWITILSMSVADLISCGSNLAGLLPVDKTFKNVIVIETFWALGVSASFMLLTLLNIQIYIIIKHPIKSRLMLTTTKVVMSCMFVWVLAIGMGFMNIGYIWIKNEQVFYLYIVHIAALELAVACQVVLKILTVIELLGSRLEIMGRRDVASNVETLNEKQKDVAKTVMILNVILIVTALPYFLAKQIEYVRRMRDVADNSLFTKFSYYYMPVALLNFVLNPLLYSLRLQDYRRSLIALFKFQWKKCMPINSSLPPTVTDISRPTTNLEIRETLL